MHTTTGDQPGNGWDLRGGIEMAEDRVLELAEGLHFDPKTESVQPKGKHSPVHMMHLPSPVLLMGTGSKYGEWDKAYEFIENKIAELLSKPNGKKEYAGALKFLRKLRGLVKKKMLG